MQQVVNKSDHQTYISGACPQDIYNKYAGMGETTEDDALVMRGIWRMGVEPTSEQGHRWIVVMSVLEDIFAELPALFPEIPGPWERWGDVTKEDS